MVTKSEQNEMAISKHEEVCSERYRNIHENISDLKSRIKRLEGIIMANTVAVVCALISVFTKL
jgi:predicted nucleic acid-binding Zn ribbon protein|tara:strand:+ start:589 stop:777 length:189 start_codon:yes stop_codon:yes gene_type:complete